MTYIFGHRGASSVEQENTIAAFEAAALLGADGVELDVRRTRDGAMAVHHDAALGDGRLIFELDAASLPGHVALLDAALRACGSMQVNIEIKNAPFDPDFDASEHVAAQVVELVNAMGVTNHVIVSSFALSAINAVRLLDPSLATGWLTSPRFDQLRALDTAIENEHRALHPHFSTVTNELVGAAHAAGVAINTWTVDDRSDMESLAVMGVDAIVTNDVALAVATLR